MKRNGIIVIIMLVIGLTGCATTTDVSPTSQVTHTDFDVEDMMSQADKAGQQKDYMRAYKIYTTILRYDSALVDVKIKAGEMALAAGDTDYAYKIFTAIASHKTLTEAQKEAVNFNQLLATPVKYLTSGDRKALEAFTQAQPNDSRIWNKLGHFYDHNKDWVSSQEAYVQAIIAGGLNENAINNLGMSLLMRGEYIKATEKFTQAHEINPDVELFLKNWHIARLLAGDEDILQNLQKEEAETVLNTASAILLRKGETEKAKTLFQRY